MIDCVSREAALKAFEELPHEYKTKEQRARTGGIAACQVIVEELPPVTPKQKTGKWIAGQTIGDGFTCGECNTHYHMYPMFYKFCPICGAKMEGESRGEEA